MSRCAVGSRSQSPSAASGIPCMSKLARFGLFAFPVSIAHVSIYCKARARTRAGACVACVACVVCLVCGVRVCGCHGRPGIQKKTGASRHVGVPHGHTGFRLRCSSVESVESERRWDDGTMRRRTLSQAADRADGFTEKTDDRRPRVRQHGHRVPTGSAAPDTSARGKDWGTNNQA